MYEILRGWGPLCKFMYFPTNAVVAEYFSLAWSIKQAQGYNWGQLGLFLQTLFSGGSSRPLLANDQHWEMLRQTEENCITKTCWDCCGMTSNGRKSKYNICLKRNSDYGIIGDDSCDDVVSLCTSSQILYDLTSTLNIIYINHELIWFL